MIRLVGCRVLPSALTLAFLGTDASPAPPQLQPFSDPIFAEVSARVGLAFKHVGGNLPLNHAAETMGSGGGFLDFDNDGWIDVYLVNGGLRPGTQPGRRASNRLFRNNGDGSFTDVTKKAGVGDSSYGMGCAFADYDNDGLVDIYVTNLGPNLLYRNNGDGTFANVTPEAGVGDPRWSTSAAFGDYDRDGHLDLYVCNYLKVPFSAGQGHHLSLQLSGRPQYALQKPGRWDVPGCDLRGKGAGRPSLQQEPGSALARHRQRRRSGSLRGQ